MWNTVPTRENVEELLDAGRLQAKLGVARWWTLERTGRTRYDPLYIPASLKRNPAVTQLIVATDFDQLGVMDRSRFRARDND